MLEEEGQMGGVARGVRRLVVVQHVCFYGGSVYVCVRVRACVRVGVYACVYAHTCVCVCVCVCVCARLLCTSRQSTALSGLPAK